MALIDTLRGITATEDDDYYTNSTLVFYVNRALYQVVSIITAREKYAETNFRVLDALRTTQETNPSGFSQVDDYYQGTETLPADFLDWIYAKYNDTPLKELSTNKQYLLSHGNAVPEAREGYFSVGNDQWKLFIHEDPDGASDEFIVEYIKQPTEIVEADESFAELPDQMIGTVLYKAAVLMSIQEQEDPQGYQSMFNQELETNLF